MAGKGSRNPGVEAVTIATPPLAHAALVLQAVAAGIVHLLGTEFRFDAGQALMARAIAEGAVGEPRLASYLLHVPMLADVAADVPDWWASAEQGGGWLGAHGSQVIDQIRFALGDFAGVSASLTHLAERGMSADDGFVVHFRLRSGLVGSLQSTSGDWGSWVVVTRVCGPLGSLWMEGLSDAVFVADRSGTRQLPVPEELRAGPPEPAPPMRCAAPTSG